MKNKTIRIENVNVNQKTYERLLELKEKTGIPMKSLISLILNISVKDIEIEHITNREE